MKKITILFALILSISFVSCSNEQAETKPLKLLISKDAAKSATNWMLGVDSTLDISIAYGLKVDSALKVAAQSDAIIITGGDDVNPMWYGKPEYAENCEGFDNYRDTLEISIIKYAIANKIPILGICRGHQIMNVANGGTMIPDIQTFLKLDESTHRDRVKMDSVHTIIPVKDSWILKNYPNNGGEYYVNTIHHQSVDAIADNFELAAKSPDGVVESIILKDKSQFALGVQWHPERSRDEFATVIGNMLLDAARK